MAKRAVLLLFLLLGSQGCSDNDIDIIEVEATVQDVRDVPGFEDCAWLLLFNGQQYKPSYLPPSYQEDGLQVRAKVELLTETASCNSSLELLRIEQIALAN